MPSCCKDKEGFVGRKACFISWSSLAVRANLGISYTWDRVTISPLMGRYEIFRNAASVCVELWWKMEGALQVRTLNVSWGICLNQLTAYTISSASLSLKNLGIITSTPFYILFNIILDWLYMMNVNYRFWTLLWRRSWDCLEVLFNFLSDFLKRSLKFCLFKCFSLGLAHTPLVEHPKKGSKCGSF